MKKKTKKRIKRLEKIVYELEDLLIDKLNNLNHRLSICESKTYTVPWYITQTEIPQFTPTYAPDGTGSPMPDHPYRVTCNESI